MGLIRTRVQSELRSSWKTMVALALVLGIGGGIALTALAGARRTDSAISQFVSYSRPDDGAFLYGNVTDPPVDTGMPKSSLQLLPTEMRVVDLPQVAEYFQAPYLYVTSSRSGYSGTGLNAIGATNASLFRSVDRPLVIAGRLPDPRRPYDVAINELAAQRQRLHVGSVVHLFAYSMAQSENGNLTNSVETANHQPPAGPTFTVRVTAVVRFPQDVNAVLHVAAAQDVSYEGQQNVYLTPAFLQRLAAGLGVSVHQIPSTNFVGVRLRHGAADWDAFANGATRVGGGQVFASPGNVFDIRSSAASTQRGIRLEAVALVVFGSIAGLVTLLLLAQAIARMVALEQREYITLSGLGASRSQLIKIVLVRAALIGATGSVLAVGVAVLASPLMPVGPARQAEIHPGINIDLPVLLLGLVAMIMLVMSFSYFPARRVSRMNVDSSREAARVASPSGGTAASSSFPMVASIGIRFGLDPGRGRTGVPVLGAIITRVASGRGDCRCAHLWRKPPPS